VRYCSRKCQSAAGTGQGEADWPRTGPYRVGWAVGKLAGLCCGLNREAGAGQACGFHGRFRRDSQIGSGSTDLILGGFHRGMITDYPAQPG
jgi:hypothetical protein